MNLKLSCAEEPRCRGVLLLAMLLAWGITGRECIAQARDGGDVDGAVWKFSLKPKSPGPTLGGRFRVEGKLLYQHTSPEERDFKKQVGTKVAGKQGRTSVAFTDLGALDRQGVLHTGLRGTALLTFDRFGEWSGTFVDGDGKHWDFRCTRIQE